MAYAYGPAAWGTGVLEELEDEALSWRRQYSVRTWSAPQRAANAYLHQVGEAPT